MADKWNTISFDTNPLEVLKEPLGAALVGLRIAESIIDGLLDIIKSLSLDLSNPLNAIASSLLAVIQALIKQIKSLSISVLPILPDYSRNDFNLIMSSCAGGFSAFESKIVAKFFDSKDVFRPSYGSGSTTATAIFYIGTESHERLITQSRALAKLITTPNFVVGLPTPVGLKAMSVKTNNNPIDNIRATFDSSFKKVISLEWKMPTTTVGTTMPGFTVGVSEFVNSYRLNKFIIERSEVPNGENCVYITPPQDDMPEIAVPVQESDGSSHRIFSNKKIADVSLSIDGKISGSYHYTDEDPTLEFGKVYYYRVRSYVGEDPTKYALTKSQSDYYSLSDKSINKDVIKISNNEAFIKFGDNTDVSLPTSAVKAYLPKPFDSNFSSQDHNLYDVMYDAVAAAVLLNFDVQRYNGDDENTYKATIGWGTISSYSSQIRYIKNGNTNSNSLKNDLKFKYTVRIISNSILSNIMTQYRLIELLRSMWSNGVKKTVSKVMNSPISWTLPVLPIQNSDIWSSGSPAKTDIKTNETLIKLKKEAKKYLLELYSLYNKTFSSLKEFEESEAEMSEQRVLATASDDVPSVFKPSGYSFTTYKDNSSKSSVKSTEYEIGSYGGPVVNSSFPTLDSLLEFYGRKESLEKYLSGIKNEISVFESLTKTGQPTESDITSVYDSWFKPTMSKLFSMQLTISEIKDLYVKYNHSSYNDIDNKEIEYINKLGITEQPQTKTTKYDNSIYSYLNKSDSYEFSIRSGSNIKLNGQCPINKMLVDGVDVSISVDERRQLVEFLQHVLPFVNGTATTNPWYSVSVGDMFPAMVPFMFDFEQYVGGFSKSTKSSMAYIEDSVNNIKRQIQSLESILESINQLIDLFNIEVSVSAFVHISTNSSIEEVVKAIQSATNKPQTGPNSLHSGLVLTCGGPGEGSIAAFEALKTILGL